MIEKTVEHLIFCLTFRTALLTLTRHSLATAALRGIVQLQEIPPIGLILIRTRRGSEQLGAALCPLGEGNRVEVGAHSNGGKQT